MKNKQAFPVPAYTDPKEGRGQNNTHTKESGMTLKEYYVGQILSNHPIGLPPTNVMPRIVTEAAIALADEVIKQLDGTDKVPYKSICRCITPNPDYNNEWCKICGKFLN